MALTREDWGEVIAHTRMRVREIGLESVDARIVLDGQRAEFGGHALRDYFDSLIRAVSEISIEGYRRTMEIFQEAVTDSDGRPIEGIEVLITDEDSMIIGGNALDLADVKNFDRLVRELKELRRDLSAAGVFDEQEND